MMDQKFETGYTKTLKAKFMFFAPLTLAYAIFYTFCMYKNAGGITFPFFIAGTAAYLYLCVTKLGATFKKSNYFLLACAVLISIATPFTGNRDFWFYNKAAIFILIVSVAVGQFYETTGWGFQPGKGTALSGFLSYPPPRGDYNVRFVFRPALQRSGRVNVVEIVYT